jgi:hypothetical protein
MFPKLFPLSDNAKQKAPKKFGALIYYYKYSNDITNPVKRLYATTIEY